MSLFEKRLYSPINLKRIWNWCSKTLDHDDLSLLIACQMVTRLPIRSLLGWFNENVDARLKFLRNISHRPGASHLIRHVRTTDVLFPHVRTTYLKRLKRFCCELTNTCGTTFELITKSVKKHKVFFQTPDRMNRFVPKEPKPQRPKTPEHFWELDFPDEEECIRRGYINIDTLFEKK
jgi:hypothetical protein